MAEKSCKRAREDAIVLGDFNRFLKGKKDWKRLMIPGHEQFFRFPLLEAIKADIPDFDLQKHDAPEDKYSTTTSASRSIYDQILISKGSYREFAQSPLGFLICANCLFRKTDEISHVCRT